MRRYIYTIIIFSAVYTMASDVKSPTNLQSPKNRKWLSFLRKKNKRSPKNKKSSAQQPVYQKNSAPPYNQPAPLSPAQLMIDTNSNDLNENKQQQPSSPRSPTGQDPEHGTLKALHQKHTKKIPYRPTLPGVDENRQQYQNQHTSAFAVTVRADMRITPLATLNNLLLLSASQNSKQALDCVVGLLQAHADIETKNDAGQTPLMLAVNMAAPSVNKKSKTDEYLYSITTIQTLQRAGASLDKLTERQKKLIQQINKSAAAYSSTNTDIQHYATLPIPTKEEASKPHHIMIGIENLPSGFLECMQLFNLQKSVTPESLHSLPISTASQTSKSKDDEKKHAKAPNVE